MAKLEPFRGNYYLWLYLPSLPAALVFLGLFLIVTVAHFLRLFRERAWFCLAFAIGCLFEVIGFSARSAAHYNTSKLMPFAVQNVFILLPPALFAASIYMTLGRLTRATRAEKHSVVPVRWLTKLFVSGDILSFLVQGGAAGLMVTEGNAEMGENIVIAGLFIQIVMFGFFVIAAIIFHRRMSRSPTTACLSKTIAWEKTLWMLYLVSLFIMIRSIFRVVEYVMGQDGYLLRHEWTMYVFDSVMMLAVTLLFYFWYPGTIALPAEHDEEVVELDSRK